MRRRRERDAGSCKKGGKKERGKADLYAVEEEGKQQRERDEREERVGPTDRPIVVFMTSHYVERVTSHGRPRRRPRTALSSSIFV